ncbi:hypothetical protein AQPE_0771 [Aquipluma nitroreducens]|uniref:Uncharacterized protein n=1 Tax=Aquipluma nitroreducens TaxID=2010828 RepID=A0A5K7S4Z0_9BACT|nr:hypothetical protein AQPE_0771 [Aquipluma nitroreducens]
MDSIIQFNEYLIFYQNIKNSDRPCQVSRKTSEDGIKKSFLFEP